MEAVSHHDPTSPQQLIAEVKSIYAGPVIVEQKCTDVIADQDTALRRLQNEQSPPMYQHPYQDDWPVLIAVHQTLLDDHHDFLPASQHPAASVRLEELASKYSMPAYMSKHGIHDFLELSPQRLSGFLESMFGFICLVHHMVALLFDTVGTFKENWVECLGNLARYRMAIQEDKTCFDRTTYQNISRLWNHSATGQTATTGSIIHHPAILTLKLRVSQQHLYCTSLGVPRGQAKQRQSEGGISVAYRPERRMTGNSWGWLRFLVYSAIIISTFAAQVGAMPLHDDPGRVNLGRPPVVNQPQANIAGLDAPAQLLEWQQILMQLQDPISWAEAGAQAAMFHQGVPRRIWTAYDFAITTSGIVMAATNVVWIVLQMEPENMQSKTAALASTWAKALLSTIIVSTTVYIGARCRQIFDDIRENPQDTRNPWRAIRDYIIKTSMVTMGGVVVMVIKFHAEYTPHLLVTFLPPALSLAAFGVSFFNL